MNRYQDIKTLSLNKKLCYQTTRYPEVPLSESDIYVYTVQGDRFDSLAYQYYSDQSLWWVISIANTAIAGTNLPTDLSQDSLIIPAGSQIRIPNPKNFTSILNSFKKFNNQ